MKTKLRAKGLYTAGNINVWRPFNFLFEHHSLKNRKWQQEQQEATNDSDKKREQKEKCLKIKLTNSKFIPVQKLLTQMQTTLVCLTKWLCHNQRVLKVIGETTKEILNYNTMQVGRQVENTFKTEVPQNSHHFTRLDASRKWKALSCRSFTWDVNKKIQKARLKTGS